MIAALRKSGKKPAEPRASVKYRFSRAAEADLREIARYGDQAFGQRQSNQYRQKRRRRLETIAEFPMHYPRVDNIRQGYRRAICESHSIYYRIERGCVLIVRILGRQDPLKNLR